MKLSTVSLLALSAAAVNARFVEQHETDQVVLADVKQELYLIELAPGKTQWVTEDEKWELRRNGQNFMDITATQELGQSLSTQAKKEPKFPAKPTLQKDLAPLIESLSKDNMKANLEKFTSFHTRYYKSDYGKQSSEWRAEQSVGSKESQVSSME
jgi:leucyl aminopeptidase